LERDPAPQRALRRRSKKIPYASKVVFPDAACVAVDSGPNIVTRKAARSSGRNAAERNAIVIDRFFNTKQEALT